jgi:hypothetical protein
MASPPVVILAFGSVPSNWSTIVLDSVNTPTASRTVTKAA